VDVVESFTRQEDHVQLHFIKHEAFSVPYEGLCFLFAARVKFCCGVQHTITSGCKLTKTTQ